MKQFKDITTVRSQFINSYEEILKAFGLDSLPLLVMVCSSGGGGVQPQKTQKTQN